ncbi:IRF3 factor, partial [Semnornis frantzii]|nr:IRF3 factor [Semnornis frantzii]
ARREAQKLRFGPWLLAAIDSQKYPGLRWVDASRSRFRVPWKHNARKDVTSSDLEVFKVGWQQRQLLSSSERVGQGAGDARWKTNFRCALRSTGMFVRLEDNSRCADDPHKVF